jgi:spore coat protein U-like protein
MNRSSGWTRSSPARCLEGLALAALLAGASPARAATLCTGASTSISLGAYYGDTATPVDSIGSFALRCARNGGPQNITITMRIGASANGGSIANRQLLGTSWPDLLAYNLYRDALRQAVWGETVGVDSVTLPLSVPNNGTATATFTIYGRIPGLQNVHAGFYADSLVVTIDY